MIDPQQAKRFEELGIANVRQLSLEWQGAMRTQAMEWLAQQEWEDRSRNDASQVSQMRIALSAQRAAWIAAIAAVIAAIAAIATIVVELVKK